VTVLLLHAFPLDAQMWREQRAALERAGYAVAAPDLPGPVRQAGLAAWARHVLSLVEGPFVPVGCSMGGYLAFELWRQASGRIPALVLADTRAAPDTPEQRAARDETIRVLREEGFDAFWAGLAPKLFAGDDPGARPLAAAQRVEDLIAAVEALRDRPDSRPTLATVDVPVLVLVGEADALTPPSDAEAMAAELPDARLVRIAGAGHLTPLERPAEFDDALLAFLAELER
jgi:pimeloyl-ACP methyl ester carboxylesterase